MTSAYDYGAQLQSLLTLLGSSAFVTTFSPLSAAFLLDRPMDRCMDKQYTHTISHRARPQNTAARIQNRIQGHTARWQALMVAVKMIVHSSKFAAS